MKTACMIAAGAAFTGVSAVAIPAMKRDGGSVSITPHDAYSSSIGVLGCKVDTNRIAYWPEPISCDSNCMKLSGPDGRTVNVLQVDNSGGAHDISYDAWNYLKTGKSATADPTEGGGFDVKWERVDMSQCADILKDSNNKLAFSAANSMNFVGSCLASNTWVGQNYALYNIADPAACTIGFDELCHYDASVSSQPSCPHTLGSTNTLVGDPVDNIVYGTGKTEVAQA